MPPFAPDPLPYEPPDRRRRRSRRLSRVALVLSIVALAVVGRLLLAKFAPSLLDHFGRLATQRRVLALATPGVAVDLTNGQPATRPSDVAAFDRLSARWRDEVPHRLDDPSVPAYLGPLRNAAGVDRIVGLRIVPAGGDRFASTPDEIGFALRVRDPSGMWHVERPVANGNVLFSGLVRSSQTLHLDPPSLDPSDAHRLLLQGSADGRSFAWEVVLDAADRPQVFALRATRTTTRASDVR